MIIQTLTCCFVDVCAADAASRGARRGRCRALSLRRLLLRHVRRELILRQNGLDLRNLSLRNPLNERVRLRIRVFQQNDVVSIWCCSSGSLL